MGLRCWSSMSLQGLCIVWVLSLMPGAFAQSSNCSIDILTPLEPCLAYLTPGNTTVPGSDCCNPIRSLVSNGDPTCLCQIAPLAGGSINTTRALEVAIQCNQTIPSSVTSCLSTAPLGAPSGTPTSPAPQSPPIAMPPPEAGSNKNLGSGLLPPSLLLISSIFVALSLYLGIMST